MAKSSRESNSSSSSSKRKRHSDDTAATAGDSSADESFTSARSSSSSRSKDKTKSKSKKRSHDDDATSRKTKSSKSKSKSSRRDLDENASDTDTFASASDGESFNEHGSSSSSSRRGTAASAPTAADRQLTSQKRSSAFEIQYPIITISIAPIHASQPTMAIAETFDSLVMRYVPPLNGVLVSHGEAYFLVKGGVSRDEKDVPPSAIIDSDGAFASVRAAVECCIWRPKIGMKIEGTITLSTPSHVSLLIHSTFNASIPSSHMADYEFIESDGSSDDESSLHGDSGAGYWRHKKTKERLGAKTDGRIDFIVIGLTISSPSLSVTGSLLSAPFSIPPPRSTLSVSNTQHNSASTYGIGGTSKVTFADDTADSHAHDEAIQKATRRVRWQEEEDADATTDAETDVEVESTPRHVKF